MIAARRILVPGLLDGSGPEIRMVDARAADVDERRLLEVVRAAAGIYPGRRISRSYRFPLALLAWYVGPVGCERISPCEDGFADPSRTPSERRAASAVDPDATSTSLWSSKQALAHALGDALACDRPRVEGPAARPRGSSGPWRARSLPVGPGFVAWVCWQVQTG